ncbi:hypothetical protein ACFRFU_11275 [Streptomyces sp. NPDC056704]|uniref:hypothetical protein n=1 Tax=Streptomyces sp. NPDC056704 TaxID=3345917 RepID=UPI0036CEAEEF
MAIHVSPEVNNLLLLLIGERMLQADEDKAYQSHEPYDRLGKQITKLSELIEDSVVEVGRSLPPQVATRYVRAMNMFVDDGGRNYLKEFADELDVVARGRVETSINITEAKWQIIAEIVRLLIELAVILVMSIFSGGSTAGEAAVARAQSRVTILAILDQLMKRTHLMPSLSEAFDEAFTTFAVRLAMIAFGPDGRRPKGFDWSQIVQDAVFGGITGMFHGVFEGVADRLKNFFRRSHLDDTVFKKFDEDVLPKVDRNRSDLPSSSNNRDFGNRDVGNRDFGNRDPHDRDGFGDDIGDAVAEGAAETFGEFFTVGLFTGSWALSGDTFLTATGSALFMGAVFAGVAKFGSQFNIHNMGVVNAVASADGTRSLGTGSGTTDKTESSAEETPVHDVLGEGGNGNSASDSEGTGQEGQVTAPAPIAPGTPGTSGTPSGAPGTSHTSRNTPTTSRDDDTDTGRAGTGDTAESAPAPHRTVSSTPEAETAAPNHTPATTADDLASAAHVPTTSDDVASATPAPAPAPVAAPATTSHSSSPASSVATTPTPVSASADTSATPVTPSSVASQPRPLTQTIPSPQGGEGFRVLGVTGDGDCFFTSLLAGLHHQGHGSALTAMDVQQLREYAANKFHDSDGYREMNERDALDVLLQDLDLTALTGYVGSPPPLSAEQDAEIGNRLRSNLDAERLRGLATAPADRANLADLTGPAVRALQPGYQPEAGGAQGAERRSLADQVRTTMLRERFREILEGDDTGRADAVWSRLIADRYPRWARESPRFAPFQNRRLGDLVAESIRNRDMWATPFFDSAPQEVARALGLNITVVRHDEGHTWNTPLNPAAGRPFYVHYNGTDHYSAIENSPADTLADTPGEPAETFVRPATTSNSRAQELITLLRGQEGLGVEDRVLDSSEGASPQQFTAPKGTELSALHDPYAAGGQGSVTDVLGGGSPLSQPSPQQHTPPTIPVTTPQGGGAPFVPIADSSPQGRNPTPVQSPSPNPSALGAPAPLGGVPGQAPSGTVPPPARGGGAPGVNNVVTPVGIPVPPPLPKPKKKSAPPPASTPTTEEPAPAKLTPDTVTTSPKGTTPTMVSPSPDAVTPARWKGRKNDARPAPLRTERFDPKADPLASNRPGLLDGWGTLIRTDIRRIQADNGAWVRDLTVELPVKVGNGFDASQVPALEQHIQNLFDTHVNTGFKLPKSGDQLHVDVKLTPVTNNNPYAVNVTVSPTPDRSDQLNFNLHPPTATPAQKTTDDATLLHEVLHYTGLSDRYSDTDSLFRRGPGKGDTSGLMADVSVLPDGTFPLEYLTQIENTTDSGPVVHDHPLTATSPTPDSTNAPSPADADGAIPRPDDHGAPVHGPSQVSTLQKGRVFKAWAGEQSKPTGAQLSWMWGKLSELAKGPDLKKLSVVDAAGLLEQNGVTPSVMDAEFSAKESAQPVGPQQTVVDNARAAWESRLGGKANVEQVTFDVPGLGRGEIAMLKNPAGAPAHADTLSWFSHGYEGKGSIPVGTPRRYGFAVAPGQSLFRTTGKDVYASLPDTMAGSPSAATQDAPALFVQPHNVQELSLELDGMTGLVQGSDVAVLLDFQWADSVDPRYAEAFRANTPPMAPIIDQAPGLSAYTSLIAFTCRTPFSENAPVEGSSKLKAEAEKAARDQANSEGKSDLEVEAAAKEAVEALTAAPTKGKLFSSLTEPAIIPGAGSGHTDSSPSPGETTVHQPSRAPKADTQSGAPKFEVSESGEQGDGGAGPTPTPSPTSGSGSGKNKGGKNKEKPQKNRKRNTEASSSSPDNSYKRVITHPGYATGDQFGIAAALHGDPDLHVLVTSAALGTDPRDKGQEIVDFYKQSGISTDRVHFVRGASKEVKAETERIVRHINTGAPGFDKLGKTKVNELIVPVGAGTTWIGENFSQNVRDKVREGWRLDDAGFPQEDQDKVADWLATKNITVEPGRKVIVLWSRFSGKRGDIHVEHDTSYTGVDQILTSIHDRTKDDPPGPLVIIAGDAKVNPQRRSHYPDMARRHWDKGLAVHDLTDFWDDKAGVTSWGGDTRTGQMRLYEYLNRRSGGNLKHLGFRSGNLEAMALSGHAVNYLEEPGSMGGERMAKWHAVNSTAPLKTGYERITIKRPPTRSGQIVLETQARWKKKTEEYGTKATPAQKTELKNLAEDFKHPKWVWGKSNVRGAEKPPKDSAETGFTREDVDTITKYLVGDPPQEPTRLVTRPVNGDGRIRTLADRTLPDTVVRGYGLDRGHASFTPADWSRRARRYTKVTSTTDYSDHRPQDNVLIGGPKDVPWRNRTVSFFAAHGKSNRVTLALTEPHENGEVDKAGKPVKSYSVTVSGRELGRYLIRWGGLGPRDQPIVLYSCSTGASPTFGGLSVAQHVANVTGRPVFAPNTKTGTALDGSGQVRPILDVESADGEIVAGEWRLFKPEPSGDALTELARVAGQHEGDGDLDPFAANRTLQFVRTLRGTTGLDTDTDPELLRGLGALQKLRWDSSTQHPYTDARMTPALLTRITRANFGLPDTATPTPDQYRAVLTAAALAAPGTAPDRLVVPGTATAGAGTAGTGAAGGSGRNPSADATAQDAARDPLWEGGRGKGDSKANGSKASGSKPPKASKEEKAARFAKKDEPDPGLKKVLQHPGYATGDQFGIATYLLADENLHVVVVRDPRDQRDRSADIAAFYRAGGIPDSRIHEREITATADGDTHALQVFRQVNSAALAGRDLPSKTKLKNLILGVGAATEWIGENFSQGVRDKVREGWRLDDAGFPQEDQDKVADWLATKNITVEPGRKVIVLWSRFSGKRGDIHVEHDTSYTGVDQILTSIHKRTKNDPPGPLVIIAGDAKVNPQRRPHYPGMARKHRNDGLEVHDLTDFWDDKDGVATWGGDTRTGQMRLYEYLQRKSEGNLKHLGFRSGNLEAMALSGHAVNYLEEPGSIGGKRMAKWHAANSTAPLTTGYERILIERPPTLSGQLVNAAQVVWEKRTAEYGTKATPAQKAELKNLAEKFKHPKWVWGKKNEENERPAQKPYKDRNDRTLTPADRGFVPADVKTITDALLGQPVFTSGDRLFTEAPVIGNGDCFFQSILDSARLQDPDAEPLGESVRDVRDRSADGFTGTPEHDLLNQQDALDELIRDLNTAQLRQIIGDGPLPAPSAQDLADIEERLTDGMYRAELRRRTDPADHGVLADLPLTAVRALLPGYRPVPAHAPADARTRMTDAALRPVLQARLREQLTRDSAAAEAVWRELLDVGYARWAPTAPPLDAVRGRGVGDLVAESMRDVAMWNTPFFDHVPGLVARALGVRVVVVRTDDIPSHEINPGGARTVHVLYNGVNHYSALAPHASDTAATKGGEETEGTEDKRGSADAEGIQGTAGTGTSDAEGVQGTAGTGTSDTEAPAALTDHDDTEASRTPTGHHDHDDTEAPQALTDLVDFLRTQAPDTSERALRDLTPRTLTALHASRAENPPPPPLPPNEQSAETPGPADPFTDIEAELDTHRPPRLDRSLLPPPPPQSPVAFTDGSTLPAHLDDGSYGHSRPDLRGTDQVVREIGDRAALPDDVRAGLDRALRATPQAFHGDGWLSAPFTDSRGRTRVMRVRTRPHGVWERFADVHGAPVKVDAGHRSQVTSGPSRTVAQTKRLAGSLPIGPPAGPVAYGRIGGAVSYGRSYDYALQDQTLSQVETRRLDGSHIHLDDVQYEVSFEGAPTGIRPADGLPRAFAAGEGHFTFGVRNGLSLRLPDGETAPGEPGPVPRALSLGPESDYRLVHTEGYGPVEAIRKWALKRTGAQPGSTAHQEITGFFTTDSFHRMADRLARGKVPTRPLLGEDRSRSPLGAFVVEKVVPGEAELLSETEAAELRNTVQQTVKNERGLSKSYGFEVNGTLGPSVDLATGGPLSVRLLLGAVGRYAHSTTFGQVFGGSGGRKIVGRAKKVPTELYKVRKIVWVRRTGDAEATPFKTWSLDRMTRTEARRLAGWDDGTALRKRNGNEPRPAVYLTDDAPAVLGMARPEAFTKGNEPTLLQEFTDQVIRAAANRYPGMIAPLAELEARTGRWSDPERYRLALANTLAVIDALSHHSVAGGLEAVVTTGLRITLTGTGRLGRSHRYLWIDGTLTGRRYEGTQNDLILRGGAPGTERLDGSQGVSRTLETGFDAGIVLRDKDKDKIGAPKNTGNLTAGPRWAWQKGRKTGYGSTASYEGLAVSALPSHLHSYQLELTAKSGGYWRPRNLWRGLPTFGLLGTGLFVRGEAETDLVGGRAGAAVRGRVLLSVPDEHTPVPGIPGARPARPTGTGPEVEPLTGERAAGLATGRTPDGEDPFGNHPYQTLSVGGHKELGKAVEDVMHTASGGSWHFARPGAPAHDAMVRPFQPQYLAAEFDQTSGPGGSWTGGLFGKGPYLNRLGDLVHRTRVVRPVVVSKPVKLETEQTLGSDTQSSGAITTTTSFTVTGGGGYGTTHPAGPSLAGSYGFFGRWGRSHATTHTVTRTVTSEVDRDDENFKVLVSGDTRHDVLASSRSEGVLSPVYDFATRFRGGWVGKRLTFAADWLGHLPEKAAHRLGLLKDELGEVPRYTEHKWSRPGWLRENPFGSYPVNSLDTTAVLADFDEQLLTLNADDASRARVRSLLTPRAVRALRDRMTSSGAAAPTRIGRLNLGKVHFGGRTGTLKVELVQGEEEFDGLDHSTTFQDTRVAAETVESGTATTRGWGGGLAAGESVRTNAGGAPAAGPALTVSGAVDRQTGNARSTTRWKSYVFSSNEPHAEFVTPYRMRLTLTLDDGREVQSEEEVGRLREHVPLSLTVPEDGAKATAALAPPDLKPGDPEVTVWQRGKVTPEAVEAWRSAGPGFSLPSNGFHVRRLVGRDAVHTAAEVAVAKAYGMDAAPNSAKPHTLSGTGLADARTAARRTPLTHPGTASALDLDGGTGDASLAAFFGDALTPGGHQVAGLVDPSVAGSHGEFRLYARPDFTGAQLLTVAPDSVMESAERQTDASEVSAGRTDTQDAVLGGQAVVTAGAAGSVVPGASGTVANAADTDTAKGAGADGVQSNAKPRTGRSFLFAIPTDWLGVAEAEHDVKDSAAAGLLGKALGPFGRVRPGPQAVETRGHVLAWVREDVARRLGLITDSSFPSSVAGAWSKVTEAGTAWTEADKAYWTTRRALADARERHAAARGRLEEARRALETAGAGAAENPAGTAESETSAMEAEAGAAAEAVVDPQTPDPLRAAVREAQAELRAAEQELRALEDDLAPRRTAADEAAAKFHEVRAATDRLTRWHRLPAGTPGGADGAELRGNVPEPAGPDFEAAAPAAAPSPERYTESEDGTLTSPSGTRHTLLDVPEDGDGFYHALAEGLHRTEAGLPGRLPLTSRHDLVTALREDLATALESTTDPELLALTVPDREDTFTDAELAAAGVDFGDGTPESRERADAKGRLPLHGTLPERERLALAAAQVRRPGTTDAGWDHGTADLLPALAARRFGVTVTVVREDGGFQDFAPEAGASGRAERVVLHLKGRHYRLAAPESVPNRPPLPAPQPASRRPSAPAEQPRTAARPAHSTAPWAPRPGATGWRRDPAAGPGTLTAPDGTVHDLVEPTGDSNNFWAALAAHDAQATSVWNRALPPGAGLDRTAPFTAAELADAGETLGHDGRPPVRFHATAGRIPDDVPLAAPQERALIHTQLRTARRWNTATTGTAARMAADATGATVTIVAEDGSTRSYPPAGGTPGGRTVTLYQRGGEFLLARPRPPAPLAGIGPDDPDFQSLNVTRDDAKGLTVGTTATTAWALTPDILLPVGELGLGKEDLGTLFQRIGHRLGPAVTPEVARQRYGMPEKNFGKFRQLARERGLVIDVRPTNPTAAKWLDAGMLPKPKEIKTKTINELDVRLGAKPENIGLVGYFSPVPPDRADSDDQATWTQVTARYQQRLDEFEQLADTMRKLAEEGRFHVRDGLVMGHEGGTPDGSLKAVTGDHDVFDLATPGGGRLNTPTYDEIVEAMTHNDMAVMHGAHRYWRAPRSPFSEGVFSKILESHGPGGEPLIRFRPENDDARLVHYTPAPGPPPIPDPSVITRDLVWSAPLPDQPEHHDETSIGRNSRSST